MKYVTVKTKNLQNYSNLSDIDWEKLAAGYKVASKKGAYKSSCPGCPQIPPSIQLRDYQRTAAQSWFRGRGRGTLKMATGSGKTITALAIATELYQKIGLQVLLVVCPYRHLVAQWGRECQKFNLQPILAMSSVYTWQSELSGQLYNLRAGLQPFLTVITTNTTLMADSFQSQIRFFPPKTLIIGDEAHNLGSRRLEESLPRRNIGLRLALSATPERYFDEEGTDSLLNYFGPVLQPEFTLADAIKQGALVPYLYYPLLVELTSGESLTYSKLTKRIGWALNQSEESRNNDNLTSLLMQRSRLIGSAANKLEALRQLMKERLHTSHTLFYCGDGYVESKSTYNRQLAAVTRILGAELGYRVNTYTAETSLEEREEMRRQFERGELQGIVAIRCLDEGVDIPAIQNAVILASTGNPRQFIQRRGRILRPYPGKERATLFDTIIMPPELDRHTWEVERNLLKRELKRLIEFANLADNATSARSKLLSLQKKYQLLG